MNMNVIFRDMESYLDSNESSYLISVVYKEKFRESFRLIWNHITLIDQGDVIKDFDAENTPRVVEECINYLMVVLSEFNLRDGLRLFVSNYIFIVHNWNNNVWKNSNFSYKIKYLRRFIDNSLNISEILSVLDKITCKLSNYKSWLPPAFELSGHYYNLLKED